MIDFSPISLNGSDEKLPDKNVPTNYEGIKSKEAKEKISTFSIVEEYLNKIYDIRYNEVINEIEYKVKTEEEYITLNENNIYRELQNKNIKFSMNNLLALLRSDFVSKYNPFLEYFENLPEWDGQTDYIVKLANYVKAKDQNRFNHHFKKMLVRSIACSLLDDVFNKQAFILVHEKQNSGKSTFCRSLCPPKLKNYITENLSIDKDSLIALCENFIINLDELATLSKAEIDMLKSIFSKDKVKIRRPYDRKPSISSRRANFVGSTNKTEFLTDETGSVRWLCFEIESIDWNYKNDININSVYSQAYHLFKNGFKYGLTEQEIEDNEKENEKYQLITPEFEFLQKYYEPASPEDYQEFYNTSDFLKHIVEKSNNTIKSNVIALGKALKRLGYKKEQKFNGRYQVKGYYINFLR